MLWACDVASFKVLHSILSPPVVGFVCFPSTDSQYYTITYNTLYPQRGLGEVGLLIWGDP